VKYSALPNSGKRHRDPTINKTQYRSLSCSLHSSKDREPHLFCAEMDRFDSSFAGRTTRALFLATPHRLCIAHKPFLGIRKKCFPAVLHIREVQQDGGEAICSLRWKTKKSHQTDRQTDRQTGRHYKCNTHYLHCPNHDHHW
jgi:hypothetical protein